MLLATYLLYAAAVIAPSMAVFGGNLLTTLLGVSSLLPTYYCLRNKALRAMFLSPHAVCFLLLCVLGIISSVWSIAPEMSWQLGVRLVVLGMLGYSGVIFASQYAAALPRYVTYGNIIAICFMVTEVVTKGYISSHLHHDTYQPYDLNKGATFLALSAWVTIVLLVQNRRKWLAVLVWVVTGVVLLQLESLAAVAGFSAATLVWMFLSLLRTKGFLLFSPLLLTGLIAVPIVMHFIEPETIQARVSFLPLSAVHRLYIWEFAAHKADEHPLLGWGLSATRAIEVKPEDIRNPMFYPLPVHPHNQMAQLRLDLGIPGMVVFVLFVGSLFYAIRRSSLSFEVRAAAVAAVTGYLVIGGLGYSVWHNWWIADGFLVAAGFAAVRSYIISASNPLAVQRAVDCLKHGELVCFPTETVYALAADASNDRAVARIYAAKKRQSDKPLALLVRDISQVKTLCHLTPQAEALFEKYSPGPLTLVLPLKPGHALSALVNAGMDTIGVRIPDHPIAQAILAAMPTPIIGTSTNLSGEAQAVRVEDMVQALRDRVSLIIDGGAASFGVASTVVDVTKDMPVILREGSIPASLIQKDY